MTNPMSESAFGVMHEFSKNDLLKHKNKKAAAYFNRPDISAGIDNVFAHPKPRLVNHVDVEIKDAPSIARGKLTPKAVAGTAALSAVGVGVGVHAYKKRPRKR